MAVGCGTQCSDTARLLGLSFAASQTEEQHPERHARRGEDPALDMTFSPRITRIKDLPTVSPLHATMRCTQKAHVMQIRCMSSQTPGFRCERVCMVPFGSVKLPARVVMVVIGSRIVLSIQEQ
jgi:hypothetical protein